MYVKLVTPTSASSSWYYIRDIIRLLTSSAPTTSLLTAFNSSTSVVVDATPAGWTYVGSTLAADQGAAPSTSVSDYVATTSPINLWAISAPCLEGSTLKYVTLTPAMPASTPSTTNQFINLTAARSVTALGVATNEGIRCYTSNATITTTVNRTSMLFGSGTTIHLIATARGITLVSEGLGLMGVWETSMTDPHRFYSTAPVCVWQNGDCSGASTGKTAVLTSVIPQQGATQTANTFASCVMNITDVNTGTVYGPIEPVLVNTTVITNTNNWINDAGAIMRNNSITTAGTPVYQVSPIYVQPGQYGYPNMYVTGVYNAYWCKPGLGNSGDTVLVNGNYYTYFNSGVMVGFLAQTS
jgi:hypothetical protein